MSSIHAQRAAGAAVQAVRARTRTQPSILIAEDSSDGRDMMAMLLRLKGYDVFAAEDGLQAVEVALSKLPDLILIDLQLPKLNGLDVTRKLRRHPTLRNIPIIVVSGHDPAKHRQSALDAGCSDYLLKPIGFRSARRNPPRQCARERITAVRLGPNTAKSFAYYLVKCDYSEFVYSGISE